MKFGTAKPKRQNKKPKVRLPALDVNQRHTLRDASAYLKTSIPTVYKLIAAGRLETFREGRRRYVTGRSIAALSLPPADRNPASVQVAPETAAAIPRDVQRSVLPVMQPSAVTV